jgi:hypothetical protein
MDINKALTYTFDDERWVTKLLIGAGLSLLGFLIIPLFFVTGYSLRIVRNVMDGNVDKPLPEWTEWGGLLKDGFNLFVAGLVYTAPIWLLMCCGALVFVPATRTEDFSGTLAAVGSISFAAAACMVLIFTIALIFVSPAITIQYARERTLASCFRFSEVFAIIRQHIGDIFLAVLVIFGLTLVLGLIGIIPLIGWVISLLASIYVTFVSGHLFGQIGQKVGGAPEKMPVDPTIMS